MLKPTNTEAHLTSDTHCLNILLTGDFAIMFNGCSTSSGGVMGYQGYDMAVQSFC